MAEVRSANRELGMRSDWWWLGPVLSAGVFLRLWGIGFGLPGLYHPDEGFVVRQALAFGAGYFQPYEYVHSPLLPYIVAVLYGLHFLFGLATGRFQSPSDLAILYFNDPSSFYLLARLTSAAFGVAAIWVAYSLARKAYGRAAALVAALCVALSPILVRHAHYALYDVAVSCSVLVALTLLWGYAEEPGRRRFIVASVAVGLAVAMKHLAAPVAVSLVAAVVWVSRRKRWPALETMEQLVLGAVVALLAFVIVSPFTVLDFRNFWSDAVLHQLVIQTQGGQELSQVVAFYFEELTTGGLGLPLLIAAGVGMLYALWRRRSADIVLGAFTVSYVAELLSQKWVQQNWMVTLLPVLAIFAGMSLDLIWRAISRTHARWWPAALVVLGIALVPMAGRSYEVSLLFSLPDTRSIAREWVEANIPAGAKVLLDSKWTVPQLRESRENLTRSLDERAASKRIETRSESTQAVYGQYTNYQLRALDSYSGPTYDIEYINHEWWQADESSPDIEVYPVWGTFEGQVFSVEELLAQGTEYVVVSSLKYNQYLREGGQERWPSYYALYTSLDERCTLLKAFWPQAGVNGPVIKVYDLRPAP